MIWYLVYVLIGLVTSGLFVWQTRVDPPQWSRETSALITLFLFTFWPACYIVLAFVAILKGIETLCGRSTEDVSLNNLHAGDVFRHGVGHYMKVYSHKDWFEEGMCVDLSDGMFRAFNPYSTEVTHLPNASVDSGEKR